MNLIQVRFGAGEQPRTPPRSERDRPVLEKMVPGALRRRAIYMRLPLQVLAGPQSAFIEWAAGDGADRDANCDASIQGLGRQNKSHDVDPAGNRDPITGHPNLPNSDPPGRAEAGDGGSYIPTPDSRPIQSVIRPLAAAVCGAAMIGHILGSDEVSLPTSSPIQVAAAAIARVTRHWNG